MEPVKKVIEDGHVLVLIARGELSNSREDGPGFYPAWSSAEQDPELREFMMFDESLIKLLNLLKVRQDRKKAKENLEIWTAAVLEVGARCPEITQRNLAGSRLDTFIRCYKSMVTKRVPVGTEFTIVREIGEGKEILVVRENQWWTTA